MKKLEITFEQVKSISVNNRLITLGETYRCSCKYEVIKLYAIWDTKYDKYLLDHQNNSFITKLIPSQCCPIHAKYAKKEK